MQWFFGIFLIRYISTVHLLRCRDTLGMQTFNLRFSSLYVSWGTRTFTITLMNTSTNNQISVCHFNIWTYLAFASKLHKPHWCKRKFVSEGCNFVAYARQQGKSKSEREKWHYGFLTYSPHHRQFLVLFVCTSALGAGIQGSGGRRARESYLGVRPKGYSSLWGDSHKSRLFTF